MSKKKTPQPNTEKQLERKDGKKDEKEEKIYMMSQIIENTK